MCRANAELGLFEILLVAKIGWALETHHLADPLNIFQLLPILPNIT